MNWGTFLAEFRLTIGDTGATPKWSDDLLYIFVRDGIRDYSTYLPRRLDRVELIAEPAIDRKFGIPSDFLSTIFVECPAGILLEGRQERPGVYLATPSRPVLYYIDGGYMYLDASPGDNEVLLSYYGVHGIPASKDDANFVFTLPDMDLECLSLYCEARVNALMRNRQSQLDRFKMGNGQRSDNPIIIEVEDFFDRYNRSIEKRIPPKVLRLYRPRRYL